jgi:hypothetical protein
MQTVIREQVGSSVNSKEHNDKEISITRALVLNALHDPGITDSTLNSEQCCAIARTAAQGTHDKAITTSTLPSGNLREVRAWIETLCDAEQASIHWSSEYEYRTIDTGKSRTSRPGPDTEILRRIRRGDGPRKRVYEDLLAPLRSKGPGKTRESENPYANESYEDMRNVLKAWNRRVSGEIENDTEGRQMLARAITERDTALSEEEKGIHDVEALQHSSQHMLDALKVLRPEVASFKNQDPLGILMIMWVNVRATIPDMDDELKYLTMKAIVREVVSQSQLTNRRKRLAIESRIWAARLLGDMTEVERLKARLGAFDRKVFEVAIKRLIDKIRLGRRVLMKEALKGLQDMTVVQAGQKWAAYSKQTATLMEQSNTCAEADDNLQLICCQGLEELEGLAYVAQINLSKLADLSASSMSRALEPGVASINGSTAEDKVQLNWHDLVIHYEGSIADIVAARGEARNLLKRMRKMESALDRVLTAAQTQYREYDGLLGLVSRKEEESGVRCETVSGK